MARDLETSDDKNSGDTLGTQARPSAGHGRTINALPRLSPIRRAINLAIALSLFIGGVGALAYMLGYSGHYGGWAVLGAAACGFAGGAWIWADYINATPRDNGW